VYTLPVPAAPADAHVIHQSAQTALPFGVDLARTDWKPELFLRPAEIYAAETVWGTAYGGARLLVNVSAVTDDRQWPSERYIAVISEAQRLNPGIRILVLSAPQDRTTAERIAAAARAEVARTNSVREAFALVATATAVFTPDTSISHAAAALDIPLAVMMLPTRPQYGPYEARHIRLDSHGPTLLDLSAGRAVEAMGELLDLGRA
jgi:ADP-heptose:LPS heptosyltransferase